MIITISVKLLIKDHRKISILFKQPAANMALPLILVQLNPLLHPFLSYQLTYLSYYFEAFEKDRPGYQLTLI